MPLWQLTPYSPIAPEIGFTSPILMTSCASILTPLKNIAKQTKAFQPIRLRHATKEGLRRASSAFTVHRPRTRPRPRPRSLNVAAKHFAPLENSDGLRLQSEDDEDEFEMSEMVRQQFLQIYSQFY